MKVGQTKAALLGQSVLEVQLIKRMTVFMVRPPNLQYRLVRTYIHRAKFIKARLMVKMPASYIWGDIISHEIRKIW